LGTGAVVCAVHSVEDWVFRALDGALVNVDVAPADVMEITEDCLDAIVAHVPAESAVVVVGEPPRTNSRADFVITPEWRGGETMPASGGIAAWVARVGQPVVVPVVAEDARFCVAIDDPQADRGDHLVAQPILGGDGLVQAVLVVARRADRT